MKKRKRNLITAQDEIIMIEDMGHSVIRFTDFHWRVDDKIDVWPSSNKYMIRDGSWNIKKYEKLIDILNNGNSKITGI